MIKIVQPRNTAMFEAVKWTNDETDLARMANKYGWTLGKRITVKSHGRIIETMKITGRSRKQYTIAKGEWAVALGVNGSIRICSDKDFLENYEETE